MTEESARLRIPYLSAAQAQKHVTVNEAMTLLDTLVQLAVLDKDLSSPPTSPTEGDCYIVAAGATGGWVGWDKRVVRYIDGAWRSYLPGTGGGAGWLAWVMDEDAMYRFDGTSWALAGIEGPAGDGVVWGSAYEEASLASVSGAIVWDLDNGIDFAISLTENTILQFPSHAVAGKTGRIRIIQDATGGRTFGIAASAGFYGFSGESLEVASAPGAESILSYDCRGDSAIILNLRQPLAAL